MPIKNNRIVTLELPETIARELEAQQVSEQELHTVIIAALRIWLSERANLKVQKMGLFAESAVPFAKRLIERNRSLFEELARK